MQKSRIFAVGLAIFAMLFGAGNVAFPLELGRATGAQVFFAIMGLVITGVMVPVLGLVAASLFNGDYKKFLGMTGKIPGFLLGLVCMLLLGPFGATPRCITLAHSALGWHFPSLSLFAFSIIAAVIVFAATIKKNYVVELIGKYLAPVKLGLLFSIVILGLLAVVKPPITDFTPMTGFLRGLSEGYQTLDLIGTIFFSGLIIAAIQRTTINGKPLTSSEVVVFSLKAGIIGGLLLGAVYTGFCLLAAKYSTQVAGVPQEQLLSALASLVLGARASFLANITVAVACLTTAIALTTVFADYITQELFFGRIKYSYALLLTVSILFAITNLGFAGIKNIVAPLAVLFYPVLIVLSLANVANALWGFKWVKQTVLTSFAITLALHFLQF